MSGDTIAHAFVAALLAVPSRFGRARALSIALDRTSETEWCDAMLFYTFSDGSRAGTKPVRGPRRDAQQPQAWVIEPVQEPETDKSE